MLYFAYCTLLDTEEMHKYCPAAEPTETARLTGYRVAFARYGPGASEGGCNLQKVGDEEVLGLLYRLSPEALRDLDSIAGVNKGFYATVEGAGSGVFLLTPESARRFEVSLDELE